MPFAYEMWIDFYNGMASLKNKTGLVIASERTYAAFERNAVIRIYNLINRTMDANVQDRVFWKEKCSIALGMWPLGKSYTDKSARYSATAFQEQFEQAIKLSPKYVWIYDHGAAWYQLKKEEVERYTRNNRWIWMKESQMLPADAEILKYYSIVRAKSSRKP